VGINAPRSRRMHSRDTDLDEKLRACHATLKDVCGENPSPAYTISDPEADGCRTLAPVPPGPVRAEDGADLKAILYDPNDPPGRPADPNDPRRPIEGKAMQKPADVLLALFCLTCFRRTRHLAALRSVLGPLTKEGDGDQDQGPYAEVDAFLNELKDRQLLLSAEGGYYWMPSDVRDYIYEWNSRCASRNDPGSPINLKEQDSPLSRLVGGSVPPEERPDLIACVQAALGQSLLLALHHNRIARYYYTENYVQSSDAFAFLEYVYHRTSCIRHLTLLLEILARCGKQADVLDSLTRYLSRLVGQVVPADAGARRAEYLWLEQETANDLREPTKVKDRLEKMRLRDLRSFQLAWVRSRNDLQVTVPAEQIISWCNFLREHDLPRFTWRLKGPEEEPAMSHGSRPQGEGLDAKEDDAATILATLYENLTETITRCSYERTDFSTTIKLRAREICQLREGVQMPSFEDGQERWLEKVKELAREAGFFDKERIRKDWLYIAACLNEEGRMLPRGQVKPAFDAVDMLRPYESAFLPAEGPAEPSSADRSTVAFRYRVLRARAHLARLPFWRYAGLSGEPPAGGRDDLTCAKEMAEGGLDAVRSHLGHDPGEGNTRNYFVVRSLCYVERGRVAAAQGDYKSAYRDFDLARSGLGPAERLYSGEVEMAAAECALMHAHHLMQPGGADEYGRLAEAEPKYTSALTSLRRARDHLLNCRRNVLWWLDYNRLQALYKSDRNLWRLAKLIHLVALAAAPDGEKRRRADDRNPQADHVDRDAVHFVRTLKQGLMAVNYATDFQLSDHKNWPAWIGQVVAELLLCAGVYARLGIEATRGKGGLIPTDPADITAYLRLVLDQIGVPGNLWENRLNHIAATAGKFHTNARKKGTSAFSIRRDILTFAWLKG
jgi:hypothetical protein